VPGRAGTLVPNGHKCQLPMATLARRSIPSYDDDMASRPVGRLLDLEYRILESCLDLEADNDAVYGFVLAQRMSVTDGDRGLVGHGTLYKALGRLSTMGLLESTWEIPSEASEGRPRRRLYKVTGEGARAVALRPAEAQKASTSRTALA
jgi:PadR family transcriptional regulator PadR